MILLDNSCKVLKYATKLAGTLGTPEYSKYSRPSKKEVEILRNTQVYFSSEMGLEEEIEKRERKLQSLLRETCMTEAEGEIPLNAEHIYLESWVVCSARSYLLLG